MVIVCWVVHPKLVSKPWSFPRSNPRVSQSQSTTASRTDFNGFEPCRVQKSGTSCRRHGDATCVAQQAKNVTSTYFLDESPGWFALVLRIAVRFVTVVTLSCTVCVLKTQQRTKCSDKKPDRIGVRGTVELLVRWPFWWVRLTLEIGDPVLHQCFSNDSSIRSCFPKEYLPFQYMILQRHRECRVYIMSLGGHQMRIPQQVHNPD